jgi:hypothetical protein
MLQVTRRASLVAAASTDFLINRRGPATPRSGQRCVMQFTSLTTAA